MENYMDLMTWLRLDVMTVRDVPNAVRVWEIP